MRDDGLPARRPPQRGADSSNGHQGTTGIASRKRSGKFMGKLFARNRAYGPVACAAALLIGFATLGFERASAADSAQSVWIELGTQGGPIPSATRSQPAHLLLTQDQAILIDAGDGVAEQVVKAGVRLDDVHTVIISHLHFDHTGGLFGFLSLRFQAGASSRVTIYGPPGTNALVTALQTAMRPATPLSPVAGPPPDFRVVEIDEGATTTIGDVRVTAASNSHYALWQGTPAPISLSFRFDLPDRSIAYTGDTGPSVNVERLAQGVDLLVSNVADPDTALDRVKRDHPAMPAGAIESLRAHFTRELLTSDEIGLLAKRARVRSVVLTHFAGVTSEPDQISRLTLAVSKRFHGPIFVANDLDRF